MLSFTATALTTGCAVLVLALAPALAAKPRSPLGDQDILATHRVSNRHQCLRLCWYVQQCARFSFYTKNDNPGGRGDNCVLHDGKGLGLIGPVEERLTGPVEEGWLEGQASGDSLDVRHPCKSRSCSAGEICLPVSESHVCRPIVAAPAATLNNTVISFNVRLSETETYSSTGSNVVWDRVVDNSGRSYDLSTGRVTAPLTGRYYFAVTTVSPTGEDRANVDIMVNGSMLCRVMSSVPTEAGSCQGIRHMTAGDQAWVQAYNGTNTLKANASSFAGFLLAGAGDVSRVSFTVRMTSNKQYRIGDEQTWDQAQDNYGRSMNLTTGTFTAPVTGQYFFALTATLPVDYSTSQSSINVDGVVMCVMYQLRYMESMGSCQATARLTAGRTVWVEIRFISQQFRAEATTFSGFLVSGDQEPSVSFTAKLSTTGVYSTVGQRVVWDTTTHNTGGGYDNNTGHFTAPVAGHYFLAVTTRSWADLSADVDVVTSEGRTVCRVDSDVRADTGSCQGVVRLDRGQQVWVETVNCPCSPYPNGRGVFTGFLIQPVTM